MVKIDIVRRIAVRLNLSDAEALRIVDEIMERIKDIINEDERLEIRDFGVFQVKERKPRIGRNPRDLKEYPIPPRRVVTFRLGKDLKDFSVQAAPPAAAATPPAPDAGGGAGSPIPE